MYFAANSRRRTSLRWATALTLLAFGGWAQAVAPAPHWSYSGHHAGPAAWAELDPQYEACGTGQAQSPIDIRDAVVADLPALEFNYPATGGTLVNNGHSVQVNLPPGATLKVGDEVFNLVQFHFHTPSEEAVNGKHTDMVAHFVHKDAEGHLGVVAVLIKAGHHDNRAFDQLFAHLPRPAETVSVDGMNLDLSAMLPADKTYYSFAGSLTTPPCSEGVSWMVLKQPIELSHHQVAAFRRLFAANARPLQPLNGRVVQVSH